MNKKKYYCRVTSVSYNCESWDDYTIDDVTYSSKIPLDKADALVAFYDPTQELLEFKGPKIWYTSEPSWHYHFNRHPIGKKLKATLNETEHLFYNNKNPKYRIPHYTYRSPLTFPRVSEVRPRALACVTNFGGRAWFLNNQIKIRNKMILSPEVDLYGSIKSWSNFRDFPAIWKKGAPKNFCGPAPGKSHHDIEFALFLSSYKVLVCLENCIEENYFTEKFVNAVRAGCIPIYHPHPSVKEKFLSGAKWVDPSDFNFSPKETIAYALSQNHSEYREINDKWIQSGVLNCTEESYKNTIIHAVLINKLLESNCLQMQNK
jgi:hypothetical protein